MRRWLVITLAFCCVLSGTTLAVPTGGGGIAQSVAAPTTPTNTSAYLTIAPDDLETGRSQQSTIDVSGALALDARGLNAQFRQLTVDERFAATDSTDARRAQLRESADRIEAHIGGLRERQSEAIRTYNNGSLAARGFTLELARIDTAARQLEDATDRVAARARSVPRPLIDGQTANSWARNQRVELAPFQGPVRDHIGETLRGENTVQSDGAGLTGIKQIGSTPRVEFDPLRVYVETSRKGIVLATVDDGRYYREAFLPTERNSSGDGLSGITDALERVNERYPWAWNNSVTTDSSGDRHGGVYRFSLVHNHGQLTTILDRESGQIFGEQQRKDLLSVPTAESVNAKSGTLQLQVNRTHPTGPLELTLSTPNGEPVDGRIAIDGQFVDRTGADGTLWTVAPRGTVAIVARAHGRTVRAKMDTSPRSNQTTTASGMA